MPKETPKFDDWGYPIRPRSNSRSSKTDEEFLSVLRSLWLPLRRYRTIIIFTLSILGFLTYLTSGREPKGPKTDWSRFAYEQ